MKFREPRLNNSDDGYTRQSDGSFLIPDVRSGRNAEAVNVASNDVSNRRGAAVILGYGHLRLSRLGNSMK